MFTDLHLTESDCPRAWHGGVRALPSWRYWKAVDAIDRAGFHVLLRWSGLPAAELHHMSQPYTGLLSERGALVYGDQAAWLLGRIAWDMVYGDQHGYVFGLCGPEERAEVQQMGVAVRDAWFEVRP